MTMIVGCFSEKTRIVALCVFLFASSIGAPLAAFESSEVLFYHSFDAGASADFARGNPAVVNNPNALFEEGVLGRGLASGTEQNQVLSFAAEKNMDAKEGTLSFWVKPVAWDPKGIMKFSPTYMNFGGKGVSILVYTWGVDNNTKFLMQSQPVTPTLHLMYPGNWREGWNHMAATWCEDEVVSYCNGGKLESKVKGSFLLPPEFLGNFSVGSGPFGTSDQYIVMDELYIFKRALAADEIRCLFLKAENAAEFQKSFMQAGQVRPIIDANLKEGEWQNAGVISGLLDKITARIDGDPTEILVGYDDAALYLGASFQVPEVVRRQPVFYPTGAFKDDARSRDGDVRADDCFIFTMKGGDGALYEVALNAAGALRDTKNEDVSWNGAINFKSRADTYYWKYEIAIPWKEIGFKAAPSELAFDVRRNRVILSRGMSEWVPGGEEEAFGRIAFVSGEPATVTNLSSLSSGEIAIEASAQKGTLSFKAGELSYKQDIAGKGGIRQTVTRPVIATALLQLADASGKALFERYVPFAKMPSSQMTLIDYPGAGVLLAVVDTLGAERSGLSGKIELVNARGTATASSTIAAFKQTRQECRLDVKDLPAANYTVRLTLSRDGQAFATEEMPYQKKALPKWYGSKAGVIEEVLEPWVEVTVEEGPESTVIRCLGREFEFKGTLFPSQITSAGAKLLASPVRIKASLNGREEVLTAGTLAVTGKNARRCSFVSRGTMGAGLSIRIDGWIAYDGLFWFDLTLDKGAGAAAIDHLYLEVPLSPQHTDLVYTGSYSGTGTGLLGSDPRKLGPGSWIGDGSRGIQWIFPSQKGWVFDTTWGEIDAVPGEKETLLRFRLVDKPFKLTKARTITIGLHPTPAKPMPKDYPLWRFQYVQSLPNKDPYRFFSLGAWGWCYPNYPVPKQVVDGTHTSSEKRRELAEGQLNWQKNGLNGINCLYMFGPYAWVGSPEYADWYHEWAWDTSLVDPDAKVEGWGPACHNSSFNDLVAYLMDRTVKWYPVWGLYFDCTGASSCSNEFHGCGYVDENGERHPEAQILGTRSYYERLSNILKLNRKGAHLNVHESGCPHMAIYSSVDSFTEGEQFATGLRGRKGTKPEEINYYDYVTIPFYRAQFAGHNFGMPVAFLPEFSPASGDSEESRRYWYAQGRPEVYIGAIPADKKQFEYEGNAAVEHLVGMSFVHDGRLWMTYCVPASYVAMRKTLDDFGWSAEIEFLPYWDNSDYVTVDGGVPEKIVTSIYRKEGRALIVPFNDTDESANLTIRLNPEKLGIKRISGTVKDLYRWQNFEDKTVGGTYYYIGGKDSFEMKGGVITCDVPPRSFRALFVADDVPD